MQTRLIIVVAVVLGVLLPIALGRRAARSGRRFGTDTIVRCRDGHLFTTVWLPGVSVKAVRLGRVRMQWCPVGRHWTAVEPVDPAGLSDAQLRAARRVRDTNLP